MKNIYYALFLSILVVSWMAFGQIGSPDDDVSSEQKGASELASDKDISETVEADLENLLSVEVERQQAQSISENLQVSGHTEPNKIIQLRAELSGKVNAIFVSEGEMVRKGQLIASLELRDKQIKLQKALALQTERQNAYKRTQKLVASKLQSQNSIEQALSQLKSAQAEVASVELELERTKIYAPFAGLVDQLDIEVGTFVESSTKLATVIAIDPLVISVNIPQQAYSKVKLGQSASIQVINGERRDGKLKYLSSLANSNTRSFKAEIEIDNKDGSLPAGLSTKVTIATEQRTAHFISPALLSLDNDGNLGVKTVNSDDRVEFHKIDIINSESTGLWVSGLPESADIITVGQGFVRQGTKVLPEPPAESHKTNESALVDVASTGHLIAATEAH